VPKIEANDLNFHYWLSGKGPDIVLVHGLGGNLAAWHLQIVPQLQSDFRLLTYDLRGHGRSDAPPMGYTTSDMARDLKGILDGLGIEKAAFVGHSWGTDIVLHFALLHQERVSQMVLVESALLAPLADVYRSHDWHGWAYVTDTIEALSGRPVPEEHAHDLEYLLKRLIEIPIQFGPAQGRPRDEELVFRVMDIMRPVWEGGASDGNMPLESLASIPHPTRLIYESNSVFLDAYRELSQRLPGASSVMLQGAQLKHFSSLEHPDEIVHNIRSFLGQTLSLTPDASQAGG
jgi:pimeloyl-ACP methyl ester carboxylesterase